MARTLALLAAVAGAQASVNIWPFPLSTKQGTSSAVLAPSFKLSCATATCPDPLAAAFTRYAALMTFAGAPATPSGPSITGLTITVGADAALAFNVSEAYTLNVPASGMATATADTQWGALRALETFSQLFEYAGNSVPVAYVASALPTVVDDAPRYPWRGLLIDSSRHFLTVSSILDVLDGMALAKLNVLHWHVVDDNSWPLQSVNFPNFSANGAYAADAVYTHDDVSTIVQYARERGIMVMPEFDGPAHADVWGKGYPQLVISCSDGQVLLNPVPSADGKSLDVYSAIDGLLGEFMPLFSTAPAVHFGGDEVSTLECWAESAAVQGFMKANGWTNVSQVRNFYELRVQQIAASHADNSMFWEEVFDKNFTLLQGSIVDIWLSLDELEAVLAAGHPVVQSYNLYLDQQVPPGPQHYFWADTWQNFWGAGLPINNSLIYGGSLSMWGEQVDSSMITSRVFPRALGGAERLWGPAYYSTAADMADAEGRLEHARCHLMQRGIANGPIRPASEYVYCPLPKASRFNQRAVVAY